MILSLAVAMARDGLIGRQGGLPWHLPRDLRRFRRLTMGRPILMGRRTFESIGRPLDGRLNIVLSQRERLDLPAGCRLARSFPEALAIGRAHAAETGVGEVVVIGGASLFREALPLADRVHRTLVEGDFEGDTYFPCDALRPDEWRIIEEEYHPAADRNPHPLRFQTLERVPG